jgi:hypothetical protein
MSVTCDVGRLFVAGGIFAAELEPNALPGGLTREEFLAKVQGRTKGATGLIGLFKKPD